MKILTIAWIALKRFIRDRTNLFFVFLLPVGIIALIGAQFGGVDLVRVGVHHPADAGPVAAALLAGLGATPEVALVGYDSRSALEDAVGRGGVPLGLIVPARMSERVAAGESPVVEVISPRGGVAGPFEALVRETVDRVTESEAAIRFVVSLGADRAAAAEAVEELSGDIPPITVTSTSEGQALFQGVGNQFEIGASSQLLVFMFLTGLTGSAALIQSRRYGVTRRMLGTPTSAFTVVTGEALGRFAVVLVQGLYIMLATTLIFGVAWGNLLGAAAIILLFGLSGAGGAMLFGALFKRDDQAAIVGVVTGLGLAAIGGCMLPLELFGPTLSTIAHFTPHAWANEAFADLLRRDATVADILPQLGVLAAFGAGFLALAAWRMAATLKSN